jgi:hypothetical protein
MGEAAEHPDAYEIPDVEREGSYWDHQARQPGYEREDGQVIPRRTGGPAETGENGSAPLSLTYAELSDRGTPHESGTSQNKTDDECPHGDPPRSDQPDPVESSLEQIHDVSDRQACEELLELYERMVDDNSMKPERLRKVKESGDLWRLVACENRCDASRDARPMASGDPRADPLQAAKDARANRAVPMIELFDQLADTARETGVSDGLGVIDVELTIPARYHDQLDYDDRTPLLQAARCALQTWWSEELGLPGEIAPMLQLHRASSTLPHEWTPHVHGLVPAMARLVEDKRPRNQIHTQAEATEASQETPVWYVYADGARGKQPSDLHVPLASLDRLNELWATELEDRLGLEPVKLEPKDPDRDEPVQGFNTDYEYLHYDAADLDEDGEPIPDKARLIHKIVYDTRDPLEDLNHRIQDIHEDTVEFQDKNGEPLKAPIGDVMAGVRKNFHYRPSHWRQGGSYGWLADSNRRRTAQELGLEDETKGELKDRLADEATTCDECGEDVVIWGEGSQSEAESWVKTGVVPASAELEPDRMPDKGPPPWSNDHDPSPIEPENGDETP